MLDIIKILSYNVFDKGEKMAKASVKEKIKVGERYGLYTVVEILEEKSKSGKSLALCQCECGSLKKVIISNLLNGNSKSCGCRVQRNFVSKMTTHNKSNTRLYRIYSCMKTRCYNKNRDDYKFYGGRGIKVCQEWIDNFMNFYNWAVNNGYSENLTIDRIDCDKDYTPQNCRWVDFSIQNANKKVDNRSFSGYKGITWNKQNEKWRVRISYKNKLNSVGCYENLSEAIIARNEYIKKNKLPHPLYEEI